MQVHLTLFGLYRDKLPKEARGKADLDLVEGTTIADVLAKFAINGSVACALNGEIERDVARELKDGDQLQVFRPAGGGTC